MYSVLIIDDDKLERKGLISIVPWEECGMRVVGDVANGMLALEFLETHPVDLAVVDVSMPVLSGLDFIRESRARWPHLQYVVLSFHEDFEYVQSALRLGALDYISKLRLEELDCADVFRRVGRLLRASMEPAPVQETVSPEEQAAPERMEALQAKWCSLQWLFDTARFETMLRELEQEPLASRQAERLLMRVSQEIEASFGFSRPVPFLSERGEAVSWLRDCRKALCAWEPRPEDLARIPVCILRAAAYIRAHLTEKLKAEQVAAQINMSRAYFSVNFKAVTGVTFNDFLRNERIELAKSILQRGAMRPGDLAEAVGYEDGKHFSRVFLEQTGVNCSEYAKQFSPSDGSNARTEKHGEGN